MPVMYSFCFWFSVRLGSMLVGVFSLMQSLMVLVCCIVGLAHTEDVSAEITYWVENKNLLFLTDMSEKLMDDPNNFLILLTVFFSFHALSCLLLIFGAFKVQLYLMYPFIFLEFCRLVVLCVTFVFTMMIVKENMNNMGLLIGASVSGGFTLLYLWYVWFCPVSMHQVVKELERVAEAEQIIEESEAISKFAYPKDGGVYPGSYGQMGRPYF